MNMDQNSNATDLNGNPAIWLNAQLKDAKSALQDMRHQNQNLQVEIRAINDKRMHEGKELAMAQEKMAELIGHNRQLCSNIE